MHTALHTHTHTHTGTDSHTDTLTHRHIQAYTHIHRYIHTQSHTLTFKGAVAWPLPTVYPIDTQILTCPNEIYAFFVFSSY